MSSEAVTPVPADVEGQPGAPRQFRSAGGPDVRVYTQPKGRNDTPQPGVLTGNGSVFLGSKGIMATRDRGEGVWLLPSSRWKDYELPPQFLTRSPGHMIDWIRACKGGDPSCSNFAITAPYAEWLALVYIAWRVPCVSPANSCETARTYASRTAPRPTNTSNPRAVPGGA